ncbi:hypothetical protein MGG_10140 [Pyricularia oryzae 70-15]|uniref:Ribosomal protein S21 n=3 Tax=Pyricularia oryzae TaxID=318829 RepID=G4NG56_PYRO7|nr:uncharacterized protein MGG_10140 [Pyricularia oryzae 70-15]EHA47013.1 hypothetical protein MGG_10140 [Pyricularia oryzae 70-15]ELQ32808.1 hypothetical protein OOU_Y34scaffold01031g4 [Pyricularia oryzae Y34]KAI7914546.1 hypothetical protein M9X92_008961 [Pyricularia oryzae]KAI7915329.1 hypothetical protein M0657_009103 [Pyricularia oryzae]
MEARHAVQSALRTATSSTRVTAALLAMRRSTPAASSIVRQQSSITSATESTALDNTSATQTTAPAASVNTWPVPATDKSATASRDDMSTWVKPRSSSTIGGRSANATANTQNTFNRIAIGKYKLFNSRPSSISEAFVNEAKRATSMGNLPGSQQFNLDSFLEKHRMQAITQEWSKRLRPVLGRTVPTTPNVDAAKAFQLLQLLVRRNNVAGDFHRQRFHERGGLKRKRLKSQRWRARFKTSFVATVKRVQQLVKQGW